MNNRCPHCGYQIVDGTGQTKSDTLVVSSYPDFKDQTNGRLLSGDYSDILRHEFAVVGIQLSSIRFVSLWRHVKPKKETECDLSWHVDHVAKEIKGKKRVLLMGSDASRAMFGKAASDLYGIIMKHKLFPGTKFVVSPGHSDAFNSGLGELRLALKRFSGKE